jgi:hypothetical protein
MVCTPIYSFSALEGKYLETATSLHPIEAEGYKIHPDFISLVRELNFTRGLDENSYKHQQDFEEICDTVIISGMNHETLKWKAFLFSVTVWTKQWYKLHVSSCHGSWVILKDQFYFTFFPLSKIITINFLCWVQSYLFQMPCLCSILCTGWVQNLLNIWI